MANVYQSTASLSARRAAYSSEEDKSMWNFYVQKVRKRNPDALARRASLWAEYAMTCNTKRTYQTLEKHFRDILLPRIDNAPIDDEDVILILELCKVSLADNDAQRNLKRRLRKLCELTINHPSLFVQRVTRLENRFQRPSNTAYNPPNYPPPVFVPDTQLPPTGTSIINKIIEKNSQEDEIVDDSFRCVNPDQPLGNDQGYLTFIQEVTLGRQQPFQPKETHFKTSSQKQPLKKTTSWSSVTSGEYLMDLSNSPVRLKTLTEEASENDDTIQQHYETAPSQPITPSTNSSPVVPDSEEAAQPPANCQM
uniref:Uncharacterized protein n=1 Tax=Ditylenchus dipsaci TaxID=166011 RepID=A0A915EUK3_9BILA